MSLVPAKIDVWGWVKYYREKYEASQALSAKKKATSLPPKKQTTSQKQETSTILQKQEIGMFEQKHLLDNDTELSLLHQKNMTLRKSLAYLDASIALGLIIENWSAYPLSKPTIEINEGKVVEDNDTVPVPGSVKAGTMNAGIILQSKALTGTSGVIRWTLGSADLVLSIMWSVPYNRQLWRTWLAVGLTSHTNLPNYQEMYSKKDSDPRFVRRQAGHRFEFSDGKFIAIANMDGDATFKPVLRIGLVPRDNSLLASNIRQKLGMKPSVYKLESDIESDFNYHKTLQHKRQQQEENMPSVGLVQTGSSAGSNLRTFVTNASIFCFCISLIFNLS